MLGPSGRSAKQQDGRRVPAWLGVRRDVQACRDPWQAVQGESHCRTSPCKPERGQEPSLTPGVGIVEYPHAGQEKFVSAPSALKATFVICLNGNILESEKEQIRLFGFAGNPVV